MTQKELIARVTKGTDYPQRQVERVLGWVLETIKSELASGNKVQLIGFGTFEVKDRKARTGINPRTGEAIQIPAYKLPTFRAGRALKETVNNGN